jgi:hypothetical protein
MREAIHRSPGRHAGGDGIRTSEVLDGREETGLEDTEHRRHRFETKNFTRSPARNRHGGSRSGRNSFTEVRPIKCQPPGVGNG